MKSLSLMAPAKLNLSLRVIGKRADGFHEIETTMVKLPSLADQLDFQKATRFSFSCDDPSLPTDSRNLAVKAVATFQAATGIACDYSLSLKKTIPHGAGLGGGSSDAAATLNGLNLLHGHPLSMGTLLELASTLGSDVPFFLTSGAALCTGRGDKITQIPPPPALRVMLFKPAFPVATSDAYRRWSTSKEISGIFYSAQTVHGISIFNDLERPVFQKHRFLAELKQWLLTHRDISAALMSGSGSTVFAILNANADPVAIAAAARRALDPFMWTWTTTTGA